MDEIRLINAEELKTDLKQYFSDGTLESVSAKLAFNMILRKIDDAPTVEFHYKPKRMKINKDGSAEFEYAPQGEWIETNSNDENIICPFCKTEFNGDIKLICGGENPKFCPDCGSDMRPEKKLQTPSCLTNPERQAELLERYKEE